MKKLWTIFIISLFSNSYSLFAQHIEITRLPSLEGTIPWIKENEELNTKELSAKAIPDRILNKEAIEEFLADENTAEEYGAILQKLFEHVKRFTLSELHGSILQSVAYLQSQLKGGYSIGYTPGKSSQWMAAQAIQIMKMSPDSFFQYSHKDKIGELVFSPNWVIFDDISYTGEQIHAVATILGKNALNLLSAIEGDINIYIVLGFMSQEAENIIRRIKFFHPRIKLHFITNEYAAFPTLESILTEEEIDIIASYDSSYAATASQTLCYTDWKIPDNISFTTGLVGGSWHSFGEKFSSGVPAAQEEDAWQFISDLSDSPYSGVSPGFLSEELDLSYLLVDTDGDISME